VNYIVKGKKYIFALLALFVLSACSVSSVLTDEKITQLATVLISNSDQKPDIEKLYGGKAIAFKPEAGFAILGFKEGQLTTLTTDPNAAVATPAVSIAGVNAWGGGKNAWGGGLNAWGGGKNAWGGGKNAWGGGYLSLPVVPSQNRAAFMQMRLPQAHALSKNFGYGIKVAVIDSGIDTAHPAFTGSLAPSTEWKDYVDADTNPQDVSGGNGYGHGTGVAGIILQVAPKATILPIRVLDQNGMGDSDDVIAAIDWAVQKGAKVINLSLGTNEPVAALKTMVSYANQMGVFVITSAGNAGSTSMTFPAADAQNAPYSDKLFSVGSVNSSGSRSSFSNYGSALKFSAPGEQIYSAFPASQSAHMTGTSFAAPIIAGAVTLALADNTSTTWKDVQFYMANSTFGAGSTGSLFGTLDVAKFLQWFPGSPRRQALFVVWDPSLPDQSDRLIKNRLESMGYVVTIKDDSASVSATDLTGKDIVLISESVSNTSVNSKYRNVTVPVVVWENGVYDDMLMISSSSSQGDASGQSQTNIVSGSHPMAAGLSGTQTVYNSSYFIAWGTPSANAVKVATLTSNANNATIFGYEKDVTMAGMTAPARRAGFFFSDFSANSYSNNNAWRLFEAAVTWALTGN
jgi:subtilisin family serine protease